MKQENTINGETLLAVARNAIAVTLGAAGVRHDLSAWLYEPGATFVTLTQQGKLRGCIGSLEPCRPLLEDVQTNAIAAAIHDSRFSPLTENELLQTRIEVSLLSIPRRMVFDSEEQAVAQLRPGVDGVILKSGQSQATFLPQVWDSLPDSSQFLSQLKRKAGLAENFWDKEICLSRYTVTKWKEVDDEPD